jgi:hypothetical protein
VELRGEGKGVYIDTSGRAIGVVLVRLHFIEVAAFTDLEAIVTVELEESSDDRVLTSHTFYSGVGETAELDSAIPEVRVVERLLTLVEHYITGGRVIAAYEGITLYNPD